MNRKKVPLAEVALLCVPLLVIVVAAWWIAQRPQPFEISPSAPQPYRLRVVEFKKLPLTAYDVSRGADTKISIKIATVGVKPAINLANWSWDDYQRIVAIKHNRAQLFQDSETDIPLAELNLLGGEGGGMEIFGSNASANYEMISRLRLRDIDANIGSLELRWDWALGPNTLKQKPQETRVMEMARLQKDRRGLFLHAKLPLRKRGEKIPSPIVSTDPLFDVRSVEFKPSPQADTGDVQIVLHIYYRGPLPEKEQGLYLKGARIQYKTSSPTGFRYSSGAGSAFVERKKGLRHYTISDIIDTSYARQTHPHLKKLIWSASISVNEAWPRQIKVPIPLPPKFSRDAR